MTVSATDLAKTHEAAFPGKGWSVEAFASYQADPACRIFGDASSFALVRRTLDEAEILTLATHPDVQGQGRATKVLENLVLNEKLADTRMVFLDVAEDNDAARALYARAGFEVFAERKGYYRSPTGHRSTALILRKAL